MSTSTTFKPKLWTPGDWNAFFGFGTNILVNMLVLTGLLRFVLKMPDSLVFGRILPALGLMMCLSTFYYAWLAYKLAEKTGRTDVCALPSGISVPHMFVVTFVIMLPIANRPIMEHLLLEVKEAGIREFIFVVGYCDEQVREYFVSRYGEWILLKPQARGVNLLVYGLPLAVLILGFFLARNRLRKWAGAGGAAEAAGVVELGPDDEEWLREALREG